MRERINKLTVFQKRLALSTILMAVVFTVLYIVATTKGGYLYYDVILTERQQEDYTTYSGMLQGQEASFIRYPNKSVVFQYGDKTYGPYTAKEDPSVISEVAVTGISPVGVVIYEGEDIFFRGTISYLGKYRIIDDENGTVDELGYTFTPEPSIGALLDLMKGPTITYKAQWFAWVWGMVVCVATIASMLYADEVFRWRLSLHVQNAEELEPTEGELVRRNISYGIMFFLAFASFSVGLV